MLDNLILFVSQFLLVFLLGFQSLNIVRGYYVLAFLTSLFLGVASWFTINIVANASMFDVLSITFIAYIFAGPIAIISAMRTHELIRKYKVL